MYMQYDQLSSTKYSIDSCISIWVGCWKHSVILPTIESEQFLVLTKVGSYAPYPYFQQVSEIGIARQTIDPNILSCSCSQMRVWFVTSPTPVLHIGTPQGGLYNLLPRQHPSREIWTFLDVAWVTCYIYTLPWIPVKEQYFVNCCKRWNLLSENLQWLAASHCMPLLCVITYAHVLHHNM